MNLDQAVIERLAGHLESCELQARDTTKITDEYPGMDWEDAYAIQDAIRRRKLARGSKIVGFKCGLTSRAKMKQMGVETPCWGFLVDDFAVADGGEIECKRLVHPKIEPEIVFVLKAPLQGPGCHIGAVLAATDFVMPGMEIIDSRYRDFKFDLKSVIADNCSSSRFVVGGCPADVRDLDLRTLGMVMEKNGEPVAIAAGAAVLGHPAASVAMLVNMLAARGERLEAGAMILTGGVTEAVAVKPGDAVTLRAQGLGSVSVRFA
jgi:2-oxo-3-hexenedioate decarboxylase